ncbi:MAG: class I SAM-dependent methyltransferase [Akkermansiaceae bacterium]|nr:class I SAM-dependent methyltransferase [Akkermansiaceae bacterium]
MSAIEDKDAWSTAAKGYSSSFAKYPLHSGRAGLDLAKVQPGEKLLDVACGPGDLAIDAAKRKGATVDCIDFSEGMIQAVREKLEQEPAAVTPHVMDGQDLQFEDASFDVVCSSFGVMLFPEWRKGSI